MGTCIKRLPAVIGQTGYPRSTLYARVKAGLFPPPVRTTARATGWPADEVDAVIRAVISGASESDLRALVSFLVAVRKSATGNGEAMGGSK